MGLKKDNERAKVNEKKKTVHYPARIPNVPGIVQIETVGHKERMG